MRAESGGRDDEGDVRYGRLEFKSGFKVSSRSYAVLKLCN